MLAKTRLCRWWLAKLIHSNTRPQGLWSVQPTSGPSVFAAQSRSLLPFLFYVSWDSSWCMGGSSIVASYTSASRLTASLLGLLDSGLGSALFCGNSEFSPQGESRGSGVFWLLTRSGWKQSSCCKTSKTFVNCLSSNWSGQCKSLLQWADEKHYLRDDRHFSVIYS